MTLNQGAHRANPEAAAQTATGTSNATARVIPFVPKTVFSGWPASTRRARLSPQWRMFRLAVHVAAHASELSIGVGFEQNSAARTASRDTSNNAEVSHG